MRCILTHAWARLLTRVIAGAATAASGAPLTASDAAAALAGNTAGTGSLRQIPQRQSLEEAWWTGPILASNAETLPPGHLYIEPYLFNVISKGSQTPGSLSYVLYGVAPRFTAGFLPSFSASKDVRGRRRLRMGDLTLDFQYRLTKNDPRKAHPTLALVVQQRLPTARHDRLKVPGTGSGKGNYATMIGLNGQQYFWLPNGRIVRARINLSHTFERWTPVRGLSSYGTPQDFRGAARPGNSTIVDIAAEYSLTKRVVLALDLVHSWTDPTVRRDRLDGSVRMISPESRAFAVAPGIEYNWSSSQGIIAGVRWIPRGHNSPSSLTPVIAYSFFK